MTTNTPSGPGVHRSNLPDLPVLLAEIYSDLNRRRDANAAAFKALPSVLGNDEDLAAARDAVKESNDILAEAKRKHEAEKAPYLKSGRDVDAFFNAGIRDRLAPLKSQATDAVGIYLEKQRLAREAEAKARAEAEAAEAAALAEKAAALEAEGRVREADAIMSAAVGAEEASAQARSFSSLSSSDQSRISLGDGSASVRTVKDFRNVRRDELDLEKLRPFFSEAAINDAIKRFMATGQTSLKGVEFYDKPRATIR